MIKCKLSDICTINPKDKVDDMLMKVSFVPMQGVSEDGVIDTSDIRIAAEVSKGFTSFMNGDVLMAKITPCMENGKGAVVTGLFNNRGFGSTEFFVIRPVQSKARSQWIYYYTTQKQFRLDCERNMTGSAGQKRVPKSYLENREILLPTLNEQDLAVQSLNQVKSIINMRKRQLQKLDELVKARFVEMFGDSIRNPFGISKKPMTDICAIIDGDRGENYPTVTDFSDEGYCLFLNAKNVTSDGFNFEKCMYITEEKDQSLRKGRLKRGDVVLTTRGTIGNLAFYTNDVPFEHIRINSGMVILRMNCEVVNEVYFIEHFKQQLAEIKAKIASGSAQPQLPISTMNGIQMLLPEIGQQREFAVFVKHVNKTKTAVQKALNEAQLLFDSLMQQYFL